MDNALRNMNVCARKVSVPVLSATNVINARVKTTRCLVLRKVALICPLMKVLIAFTRMDVGGIVLAEKCAYSIARVLMIWVIRTVTHFQAASVKNVISAYVRKVKMVH
jgi:hypothetical protein